MIPLDGATVVLPRMPTARSVNGEFPLTIVKPPLVDVKCRSSPSGLPNSPVYRLLRSRHQRRSSSASSVHSLRSINAENKESFQTERVDIFEMRDDKRQHVQALLLCHDPNTVALTEGFVKYSENSVIPVREDVVSSAHTNQVTVNEELPNESPPEPCGCTESGRPKSLSVDCVEETKEEGTCVPALRLTKRARRKLSKPKKPPKKKINSVRRSQGVTGVFTRLVHSHGKKHRPGPASYSKECSEPVAHLSPSKDSITNYLNIQKVRAAYAPKKSPIKGSVILLPKVSNTSLGKADGTNRGTLSPRKQEYELKSVPCISPLSPRKVLINNSNDDRQKKVYLSETQSGMLTGVPCAPPCTPTFDELKRVEYILSLTDVKSQRAVKAKLVTLGNKMKAEEQRKKEKAVKEEQKRAYGAVLQLKQRQRAEIYALNKMMTDLENENFRKFMEQHSAETLPV